MYYGLTSFIIAKNLWLLVYELKKTPNKIHGLYMYMYYQKWKKAK